MTDLLEFVERYIAARDISKGYTGNLRKRAAKLADFVGSREVADVFTEERVNAFLAQLTELKPVTTRSYRSDILSLWNHAADSDLVPYPRARRIRRPKVPALVVECYTLDEVRAILEQSRKCQNYISRGGVDRRQYWPAIIMLAWDTGLRRGDCWTFRKKWIQPDGTARVVQHKTGQVVTVALQPATIEALDAIPFDQPCRWPSGLSNSSRFSRQFRKIANDAGVTRGQFKWLRRSSGSYVELVQPGGGGKHLGHASPQIFRQHYDGQLRGSTAPMPPALNGASPRTSTADDPAFDEFAFL